MLLLICNRELLFIGKRKDEDDMAKSTKTYEERIRALEKKEQESIEATKKCKFCSNGTPILKSAVHSF